jgi:hypothetical protein
LPDEREPRGFPRLHDDEVGRVPTLDQDHLLLVAAVARRGPDPLRLDQPEEPHDPADQAESDQVDEDAVPGHVGLQRLSRLALVITVTELNDMASAARSGESRIPKNG